MVGHRERGNGGSRGAAGPCEYQVKLVPGPVCGRRRGECAVQPAAGSAWFSLLQIDMEVEEPETSENPRQSLVFHNIVWRRTQLLAVIIYIRCYSYLCINDII